VTKRGVMGDIPVEVEVFGYEEPKIPKLNLVKFFCHIFDRDV